jgi:hypothetical protein
MADRFSFEDDLGPELEFMPLDVRRKLDLAGLKLGLSAWQALSADERRALAEAPLTRDDDAPAFGARVEALAAARGQEVTRLEARSSHEWREPAARELVATRARELGVAFDSERWATLADDARYALARLARPEKSADKLRRALATFGLSPS